MNTPVLFLKFIIRSICTRCHGEASAILSLIASLPRHQLTDKKLRSMDIRLERERSNKLSLKHRKITFQCFPVPFAGVSGGLVSALQKLQQSIFGIIRALYHF